MIRATAILVAAGVLCTAAHAATINTTLTVNATGSISATGGINATGTANLSGIGQGTFTGSLPLTPGSDGKLTAQFTITLANGDTIRGTISIPAQALGGSATGSATITGGTGAYNGATGSFPNLTAAVSITTFNLTFSGAGQIITGGGGGGPTPPSITTVENNYGGIAPGLPNYGIAPGAIFYVKGDTLSTTTSDGLISSASPGLPTTQSGVTVKVTSGTTTVDCPLYYLSPKQINAVLPGTTPTGSATLTVTNSNGTSAAFPITVVQSAFGFMNYNGSLAAVYDTNFALLTATNAANPGQAVVFWGSGLGRDAANDDRLYPQKQNDLTGIPMTAYVGGVQATIAYRGRSQFPGLDQVVLTVPAGVPTGCYVSVALVSGNIVSNSVTMPIAASGRTCSDAGSTLPPDTLSGLAGKTTIKTGLLFAAQTTSITSRGTSTDNSIAGMFQSFTGGVSGSSVGNQVSMGSCVVYYPTSDTGTSTGTLTGLNAGSSIVVTGPSGSLNLTPLNVPGISLAGFYAPPNGQVPTAFIPTGGGSFTFDNGSGGPDVGHFNATLTLPLPFSWTNAASISTISRAQGVNVTWSGGAPGTYVGISGVSSATVNGRSLSVSFSCQAPVSAGQFTVPPPVLLALPAGTGTLDVGNYSNIKTFTATGLDLGYLMGYASTDKSSIAYQ